MELTYIHWVYIALTVMILGVMVMGKEIVVPCIVSIFLMGFLMKFSVVDGMSGLFNSIVYSGQKFMDIIVTISVVSALSRLLADLNADYLIMKPTEKIMKNQRVAFLVLMAIMYAFSLFLWPSPSTALMGAVMLPIVYKKGMKPIVAAVAINIAGHGMALSHDYIIKGAPSVTASTANISPEQILSEGRILFIVMNIAVLIATLFVLRKDLSEKVEEDETVVVEEIKITKVSKIVAVIVPIVFLSDIALINMLDLKGGDATSLIVSTSLFLLVLGTFLSDAKNGFEKATEYVRDGFKFGIKIFAPVIVIGAFFFLGGGDFSLMLGENGFTKDGILFDIVSAMSTEIPMNSFFAVISMFVMGVITGLDGSGFSGLPILGSLAYTLGSSLDVSTGVLATVGQIATVWVGGGVLIPWAVVAVSGVCNVSPMELVRKNFKPVCFGFLVMVIVAMIML